jgi:hypothetical protein
MLTETQIRGLKAREKPYKVADGRGLFVLVTVHGGRCWRFLYRFNGKQKVMSLGTYPDVSIEQARRRLQDMRTRVSEGVDPMAERKKVGLTFETVARQWFDHWKEGRHERHAHYVMKRLEADVFPEIGARPIAEIPASAFRDTARKVEKRGALDIAKRILQTCGQVLRYAVANDLATINPIASIKPSDILKPRRKRNHSRRCSSWRSPLSGRANSSEHAGRRSISRRRGGTSRPRG